MKWTRAIVVSLAILLILPICFYASGVGPIERWSNQFMHLGYTNPEESLNAPDGRFAVCSLDGFGCFLDDYNNTPIAVGGDWAVSEVYVIWYWYSSMTFNIDDHFYLKWGIGDSTLPQNPSVWHIVETIDTGQGSSESARVTEVNITDARTWTFDDLSNLWLEAEGLEELEGGDDLTLYLDSAYIRYRYTVAEDVVWPDEDPSGSDRDMFLLIMELLILMFLLILIYLFMRKVQHRFEREVQ